MKKQPKKLQLSRETVRKIESTALSLAGGGDSPDDGTGDARGYATWVSFYPGTC